MTATLFTNARLIDPEAGEERLGWLLVERGRIAQTGQGAEPEASRVIDCGGKCLAPGIVDIGVKVCEPGERHKESYRSAGLAAAAGGVTTMVTRPDTLPAIDSPESLEFVARRAQQAMGVTVCPWPR
jgi:dihydroorotase